MSLFEGEDERAELKGKGVIGNRNIKVGSLRSGCRSDRSAFQPGDAGYVASMVERAVAPVEP